VPRATLPKTDLELGRLLGRFRDGELHHHLGFARLADYAPERLGVSLRTAQELIRASEALPALPLAAAAYRSGTITASHVRLLSRVATEADEALWVTRARRMTVRRFARAVASARAAGPNGAPEAASHAASGEGAGGEIEEEVELVPLSIRAPVWLLGWWRETVTFAGRLVGSALPAGAALEVVLAESVDAVGGSARGGDGGGGATEGTTGRVAGSRSDRDGSSTGMIDASASDAEPEREADGEPEREAGAGPEPPSTEPVAEAIAPPQSPPTPFGGPREPVLQAETAASGMRRLREGPEMHAGATRAGSRSGRENPVLVARQLDARMRSLVAVRQRIEVELAERLGRVRASRSYLLEGYASLEECARCTFGLSPRRMYHLLALGRTMERLPDLRRAFVAGRLTLRAAILVGRVADRASTSGWIRRAERITLRRLEDEVAYVELLREERPELWERLRGGPLPDDIVLVPGHEPRLQVSAPPESRPDPDRSCLGQESDGLQVSASGALGIASGGENREGDSAELSASAPLPAIDGAGFLGALRVSESRTPLPARMTTIRMRVTPELRRLWDESIASLRSQAATRMEDWELFALILRRFWRTWDSVELRRQRRRNPTLDRDGWRCTAPGCRSVGTGRLHEHHIRFRSAGGAESDPANLTTLCTVHHQRLLHHGIVRCRGNAPDGLRWEMGVVRGRSPFLVFSGDVRVGGSAPAA
jgi:hypothetical protein